MIHFYRLGMVALFAALAAGCKWFKGDEKKPKGEEGKPAKSLTPIYGKDDFVLIPKTQQPFRMGSETGASDERPVHQVTLAKDYNLLAFEVPQKDYRGFAEATNREMPDILNYLKGDNRPMIFVGWEESRAFCQWVGGDLPTEAQWERAARGPSGANEYPTGTGGPEGLHVNTGATVDVTFSTPDPLVWGGKVLHHMGGNVWEWVLDWYGDYPSDHAVDPTGSKESWNRVLRGGAWFNYHGLARAANRYYDDPGNCGGVIGFRCAFSSQGSSELPTP